MSGLIKRGVSILAMTGLLLVQGQGLAASNEQLNAVKRLGELNGVALHCKGLSHMQAMKRALVQNLPKRKELGDLFDVESNNSFLKFIEDQKACPSPATLSDQVDAAIDELEKVYTK